MHEFTIRFKVYNTVFFWALYTIAKTQNLSFYAWYVCILFEDPESNPDFVHFIFGKNMID
jgi:hypothetical protein